MVKTRSEYVKVILLHLPRIFQTLYLISICSSLPLSRSEDQEIESQSLSHIMSNSSEKDKITIGSIHGPPIFRYYLPDISSGRLGGF